MSSPSRTNASRPTPGTWYSLRARPSTSVVWRYPLERAEAIAVEIEAADLATERVDLVGDGVASVEREALHRVEVDVEA